MWSEWTLRRCRHDQYACISGSEGHLCRVLMYSDKEDALLERTLTYEPILKNGVRQ